MISKINKILSVHIKDSVYAANDGVITTFAVVAGFVGAKHTGHFGHAGAITHTGEVEIALLVLLVIGFASLFADGFSMAIGNYLGTRSESDQYDHEKEKLKKKFNKSEGDSNKEVEKFFEKKGFSGEESKQVSKIFASNKNFYYELFIYDKLGIVKSDVKDALRGAIVTLISFLIAGVIPLIPYVALSSSASTNDQFILACILTGFALFIIGAIRTTYSDKKWFSGGLEMFLIGGAAAVIAYLAGYITSLII